MTILDDYGQPVNRQIARRARLRRWLAIRLHRLADWVYVPAGVNDLALSQRGDSIYLIAWPVRMELNPGQAVRVADWLLGAAMLSGRRDARVVIIIERIYPDGTRTRSKATVKRVTRDTIETTSGAQYHAHNGFSKWTNTLRIIHPQFEGMKPTSER